MKQNNPFSKTTGIPVVVVGGILLILLIALLPRLALIGSSFPGGIGGPFILTDQNGQRASDTDFRGKFLMLYFGYTSCPDVCPTTLANWSQALDQLPPEKRIQIAPVFITVDPERDTPDKISPWLSAFSNDFIGLTGSQDEIASVIRQFRIDVRKNRTIDGEYSIDHSSVIHVMDKNGRYYRRINPDGSVKDLVVAMGKLFWEKGS